jgi:hypothetical protein
MTAKFALLSYRTDNLGDEIQSIAARQFLPSVDLLVDRDDWMTSPSSADGVFKIILNGWFTHNPEKWPPPPLLHPLPISMHITAERFRPTTLTAPSQTLLEGDSLEYLKRYTPIGGRDLWTARLLQNHGVESYFSGCLTLTLGADVNGPRGDYVCAVDLDDETYRGLSGYTRTPILRLSHRDAGGGSFEQRCAAAGRLLSLYAHAKCVVTTRLHCAMPSIAFGTPTLFVNKASDQYRLSGLIELVRSCSAESLRNGEADFNFDKPTANSGAHLPLRESLVARLQAFTGTSRRAFALTAPDLIAVDRQIEGIA